MVAFADVEYLEISELNPAFHDPLDRPCKLTTAFRKAQEARKGDEFGNGNRFVGKAISLRYHVHKFRDTHPAAVTAFEECFEHFKRAYAGEYRPLLLMTFLAQRFFRACDRTSWAWSRNAAVPRSAARGGCSGSGATTFF
jgi:hypothetical protein